MVKSASGVATKPDSLTSMIVGEPQLKDLSGQACEKSVTLYLGIVIAL